MQAPFEPVETQNDRDSPCSHQGKVAISPEEGGDLTRGQRLRSFEEGQEGARRKQTRKGSTPWRGLSMVEVTLEPNGERACLLLLETNFSLLVPWDQHHT